MSSNCKSCGQELTAKEPQLPFLPPALTQGVYKGDDYCPSCLATLVNTTDLEQNPYVRIQREFRASEIFAAVEILSGVPLREVRRIRDVFASALAEHEHLYARCTNSELNTDGRCKHVVRRVEAIEGAKTKRLQERYREQNPGRPGKNSKPRRVLLFCSGYCDVQYTSRAKVIINGLFAENAKQEAKLLQAIRDAETPEQTERTKVMLKVLAKVTEDSYYETMEKFV